MSQNYEYFNKYYLDYPRCEYCGVPYQDPLGHLIRNTGSAGDCWIKKDCDTNDMKKHFVRNQENLKRAIIDSAAEEILKVRAELAIAVEALEFYSSWPKKNIGGIEMSLVDFEKGMKATKALAKIKELK